MTEQHDCTSTAKLKQNFFAMRNGIVADALREGGLPHKVIFGLQLPQLTEISRTIGKNAELARILWEDREVRESRLLACWLMPAEDLSEEEAIGMGKSIRSREEADILAFRLLRYTPYAEKLQEIFEKEEDSLVRYLSTALRRNLDAMKG